MDEHLMSIEEPSTIRRARPSYLPTPTQIAEACALIRSHWTASETIRRTVGGETMPDQEPWEPPRIDTSSCMARVRRSISDQIA